MATSHKETVVVDARLMDSKYHLHADAARSTPQPEDGGGSSGGGSGGGSRLRSSLSAISLQNLHRPAAAPEIEATTGGGGAGGGDGRSGAGAAASAVVDTHTSGYAGRRSVSSTVSTYTDTESVDSAALSPTSPDPASGASAGRDVTTPIGAHGNAVWAARSSVVMGEGSALSAALASGGGISESYFWSTDAQASINADGVPASDDAHTHHGAGESRLPTQMERIKRQRENKKAAAKVQFYSRGYVVWKLVLYVLMCVVTSMQIAFLTSYDFVYSRSETTDWNHLIFPPPDPTAPFDDQPQARTHLLTIEQTRDTVRSMVTAYAMFNGSSIDFYSYPNVGADRRTPLPVMMTVTRIVDPPPPTGQSLASRPPRLDAAIANKYKLTRIDKPMITRRPSRRVFRWQQHYRSARLTARDASLNRRQRRQRRRTLRGGASAGGRGGRTSGSPVQVGSAREWLLETIQTKRETSDTPTRLAVWQRLRQQSKSTAAASIQSRSSDDTPSLSGFNTVTETYPLTYDALTDTYNLGPFDLPVNELWSYLTDAMTIDITFDIEHVQVSPSHTGGLFPARRFCVHWWLEYHIDFTNLAYVSGSLFAEESNCLTLSGGAGIPGFTAGLYGIGFIVSAVSFVTLLIPLVVACAPFLPSRAVRRWAHDLHRTAQNRAVITSAAGAGAASTPRSRSISNSLNKARSPLSDKHLSLLANDQLAATTTASGGGASTPGARITIHVPLQSVAGGDGDDDNDDSDTAAGPYVPPAVVLAPTIAAVPGTGEKHSTRSRPVSIVKKDGGAPASGASVRITESPVVAILPISDPNEWHGVALDTWWAFSVITDLLCLIATGMSLSYHASYEQFLESKQIHSLFGIGAWLCWLRLVPAVDRLGGDFAVFPTAGRAAMPFVLRFLFSISPLYLGFVFFAMCCFASVSWRFADFGVSFQTLFAIMSGDFILNGFAEIRPFNTIVARLFMYIFIMIFSYFVSRTVLAFVQYTLFLEIAPMEQHRHGDEDETKKKDGKTGASGDATGKKSTTRRRRKKKPTDTATTAAATSTAAASAIADR